jgi:hypothetical protein
MNKDQKLLEEAYQLVLESQSNFEFTEEEEFLAKDCSKGILKLIQEAIERHGMPKRKKPLFEYLFGYVMSFDNPPILRTIKKLNLPSYLISSFERFYNPQVYLVVLKYVDLTKTNKKIALVFTNPLSSIQETVLFSDSKNVLRLLEQYFKICIMKACTDEYNLREREKRHILREVFDWREKKIRDTKLNKRLSDTFSEEDLKTLEDF